MNHLDVINGTFEVIGALAAWANIRQIRRDRSVAGVYWPLVSVWVAWGVWNLYFYASLSCWLSAAAGLVLAIGNAIWVGHAIYYSRASK